MKQAKPLKFLTLNECEPTEIEVPLVSSLIKAGFPSAAEDEFEAKLDLNAHLVQHPAATFFIKVSGTSMEDANIFDEDLLIVDRSLEPRDGKIIVARIGSEFTVKRLRIKKNRVILQAENPKFKSIEVNDSSEFEVWGVVTHIIHKAK
ncbi:MAG: translesion error-prone DNA polymerase V autoproteolytic subunit [Rhabdochlamydiaceae bacterium]|nr:translesion error-prone DNA polymerase V autoproteolytic subunit [Candidatus Amphrikana amoebophyrae]